MCALRVLEVLELTEYEWQERLQDLLVHHQDMIHFTVMCTLAHLWRHVDGECFEPSEANDRRQEMLEAACVELGYAPEGISSLVKGQREREERESRETLPASPTSPSAGDVD